MRSRRVLLVAAGAVLSSAASLAQSPAVGPQFVVNTPTADAQVQPTLAMDPSGNFTVVWQSVVPPADRSLFAQRFDVFGAAQGGVFQVESSPPNSGSEDFPSMAMDGAGNFVVAWEQDDQDQGGIYGRLFSAAGVAQGAQFQINSFSTAYQYNPSVARNAGGDFVVVWDSYDESYYAIFGRRAGKAKRQPSQTVRDGDGTGVYGQRYDEAGAPQGEEFRVNTYTTGYQTYPSVATNGAGGFVVVWQSDGQDGSDEGVFGQRYDATGAPVGAEFRVNTYTTNNQENPRVAGDSSGGFVVVWQSFGQDGFSAGIFGRRYDATGAPQGGEFLVNTATTAGETEPALAMDGAGNFVVAWRRSSELFAQRFDSAGRRVGSEFQVGVRPPGGQVLSLEGLALNASGNFVVAWQGNDGGGYGIEARRGEFRAAGVMEVDEPAGPALVARPEAITGNRVFEAGETVTVAPTWTNTLQGVVSFGGTASNFSGPAGATYTINDATANYGSVAQGGAVNCADTGDCYQMTVSGAPRPATHWDTSFLETLGNNVRKTWTLHVGESFTDVPTSQLFYRAIESVLHAGITAGCTATTYCPGDQVTRAQMSLFLARGVAGGGFAIPTTGFLGANAYNCTAGGVSLFTDVLPTDIFCRSVHYLASQNVTSGCSATQYCPTPNVTRLEMSAFVARAVVAPGGGAAVPLTYTDPVTNLSYSCDQANPNTHFDDVPASNGFCKHAHFLWAKGIISGCGATTYCPNDPVTRDAMARFLTNGFNARLYGP